MKTLIFNGSPRRKGDTMYMIELLSREIGGEIKMVNTYSDNIRPCVDCRWCYEHEGCAIKDEMQEVFDWIRESDHIVIASPVYFEEITGMLLACMSRLQTYFSARYIRKEEPVPKKKTGGILLAAGSIGPREKAESTARMLLSQMNCESLGTVYAGHTDKQPVRERPQIREEVLALARAMKEKKL